MKGSKRDRPHYKVSVRDMTISTLAVHSPWQKRPQTEEEAPLGEPASEPSTEAPASCTSDLIFKRATRS